MHTEIVKVTPELALLWLQSNTFNRKISENIVNKYARDMKNGNWTLNHQGIAFDDSGVLVDGQHRLWAIIKSGSSIDIMVTQGASRVGVDELRVRDTAAVIKFGGLSSWLENEDIQIAKAIYPVFFDHKHVAKSAYEVVGIADKYKDGILFVKNVFNKKSKGIHSAMCRACFCAAYYHFSEAKLARMVKSLYSGVVNSADEAIVIRARELLLSDVAKGGHSERRKVAKSICRAIQAYCNEEGLTKLREPKDFPFLPPELK